MKRIFLILAASAPVLVGCVTPSKVGKPDAEPPAAYEAPRPQTGGQNPAALDRWWTLFDDQQLDNLVDEALKNAPDARDALAKLQQAAAIRRETIDQLYIPSGAVQGTATQTHNHLIASSSPFGQSGTTENFSANFNVGWELDLFGRRAAGKKSADADFYTAAFTYEATRTALAANVAQSLFQARGLALQLKDARDTARISHELARIAQVKFDHGLAAQADVDQSAASAEAADAQVASLEAQLTTARRTLLVLVGKGFDPLGSLVASPVVGALPPVPSQVPGTLLRRRPDVRAAEWRIVSASGTLKTDELAVLPTIKLNPGASITKATGVFGATTAAWSIGASLAQPVLDRPRLIAQIHAQRAVAEQAVIAYEKAVQTAYSDAENAFVNLEADSRRVGLLTDAEQRAHSAYEKARLGYARGINDLTTALQAESTWRNTQAQLTSAQSTQMQRAVQVFKALGGGWTPAAPADGTPFAARAAKGASSNHVASGGGR